MNRDEILAKSRAEKDDEGMRYAETRAASWGLRAILWIALLVTIHGWYCGQLNHAVIAMVWANFSAERFSMYRFTKKKGDLLLPILAAFSSILSLLSYFFSM